MNKRNINKDNLMKILGLVEFMHPEVSIKNFPAIMKMEGIGNISLHQGQRGPNWDVELAEQFLTDIANGTRDEKHNIGVCKYYKDDMEEDVEPEEQEICMRLEDFNQRMYMIFLTASVLMWQIEDFLNSKCLNYNKNVIESKKNQLENILFYKGNIRFNVLQNDQDIFESIIMNKEISNEEIKTKYHHNLVTVYKYIKTKLGSFSYKEFLVFLENFLENTTFVLKESIGNPYDNFEAENVYRVNLTDMEKFKNLTLKVCCVHNREKICSKWDDIFESIYSINNYSTKNIEEDILRAYILSMGDYSSITKKELYEYLSYELLVKKVNVSDLLEDLKINIKYYEEYIKGQKNDYIYGLKEFGHKQGAPLYMFIRKLLDQGNIENDEFAKISKLILEMAFEYEFGNELPSIFGKIYNQVIKEIKFKGVEQGIKKLESEVFIRKDDALKVMQEKAFTSSSDKHVATYILKSIEQRINPGFNMNEKLELEHVLQETKIEKLWKKLKKDDPELFDDDTLYQSFVGRIGNLTLIKRKDNVFLKEKDFFKKRETYRNYGLISKLTYKIGTNPIYNDWNREKIKVRGQELSKIIEEMWFL